MKAPVALLVAALLTGCYAAPTSPRLSEAGLADPMPRVASAAGARTAAAPARTAAACPAPVGVLTGYVFDQDRRPIPDGATVQVATVGEGASFQAKVAVIGGVYAVSQLPLGVELEVKATSRGGFVRTRKLTLTGATGCAEDESLQASLNFGGAASAEDPTANLFYLPR
jgi:hypothetical protein